MSKLFVNNKNIITKGFRGISYIHQLYNYMQDEENRLNNSEQIEYELEMLKKTGVKNIRAFYGESLSWDKEKGIHDFESEWMQAFYKNCKDMEKLGIEIGITTQWHLHAFWQDIDEKRKKQGVDIGYNGSIVPGDIEATAINFEKFIEDSVLAFERHGITNIKYLYCFTECNNCKMGRGDTACVRRQYAQLIPLYDRFIRAVDKGLKNAGLRDKYKIVGPCDNWRADDGSESFSILSKYTAKYLADVVDIIGSHNGYDRAHNYEDDEFYDIPFPKLAPPRNEAQKVNKEYWVDEYNVMLHGGYNAAHHLENRDNPMRGVAFGTLVNSIMNMGAVHTVLIWALFDQQWPNNHSGVAEKSEFNDGEHIVGYLPNPKKSTIPTNAWYACSMLTNLIGSGDVVECEIDRPVYISAINRDDGEFTVVVTSYKGEKTDIDVSFAESLNGKTLYRYLYHGKTDYKELGNNLIKNDKEIKNVNTEFSDTLPEYCVAVYTTKKL